MTQDCRTASPSQRNTQSEPGSDRERLVADRVARPVGLAVSPSRARDKLKQEARQRHGKRMCTCAARTRGASHAMLMTNPRLAAELG